MDPAVIKAMAAFVYLAIIKDVLVGFLVYGCYKYAGKDLFKIKILICFCMKKETET